MYRWQQLHFHEDVASASKFSSKMLTDEIMDEVEMKTGSEEAARTRASNSRHGKHSNTTTSKKTTTWHSSTKVEQDNDARTAARKPTKRRAPEQESACLNQQTRAPQPSNSKKKRLGNTGKATLRSGRGSGKAESRQNRGNTRHLFVDDGTRKTTICARVEATIKGNTKALEAMQTTIVARIDALEK